MHLNRIEVIHEEGDATLWAEMQRETDKLRDARTTDARPTTKKFPLS